MSNNIGAGSWQGAIEENPTTSGSSYIMSILLLIFNCNIVIRLSIVGSWFRVFSMAEEGTIGDEPIFVFLMSNVGV